MASLFSNEKAASPPAEPLAAWEPPRLLGFLRFGVGPLPLPWGAWGVPHWRPLGILDGGIPELSPRRCWPHGLDLSRELLGVGTTPHPRPFLSRCTCGIPNTEMSVLDGSCDERSRGDFEPDTGHSAAPGWPADLATVAPVEVAVTVLWRLCVTYQLRLPFTVSAPRTFTSLSRRWSSEWGFRLAREPVRSAGSGPSRTPELETPSMTRFPHLYPGGLMHLQG